MAAAKSEWCRRAGPISTATIPCSPTWKRFFLTATSWSSTARVPGAEHAVAPHDSGFHRPPPRHDRALLSRLVPDAGDRLAPLPRVHLFHLQLLSRRAKRAAAQNLVAHVSLHALRHGHRDRHFRSQRSGSDRSAARQEERICPHSQIQYRRQTRHLRQKVLQEQSRLDALRGSAARPVFFAYHRLCHLERKLCHGPVPATLCLGLPVHRLHVPRPNVLRASPLRRQRSRNASRHFRRSRVLIFLSRTDAQVGMVSFCVCVADVNAILRGRRTLHGKFLVQKWRCRSLPPGCWPRRPTRPNFPLTLPGILVWLG